MRGQLCCAYIKHSDIIFISVNNDERKDEIEVWRVRRIVEKNVIDYRLDGVIIAKFHRRSINVIVKICSC